MASGGGEPKGDAATALAVVAVASEEVEEVLVEEQQGLHTTITKYV